MPPAPAVNAPANTPEYGEAQEPNTEACNKTANQTSQGMADETAKLFKLNTLPTYSLKNRLVKRLHLLLYQSGVASIYARLKRESTATIMVYHSIPAPHETGWMDPCNCLSAEKFEAQIRFLAESRHVISLEQLIDQLEKATPIRRGTVVITFDDGYLNNLTVAAPILAKYNLPATLYLATHAIGTGENQWIDTLYATFRARSQQRLSLPALQEKVPERVSQWDLSCQSEQQAAYGAIASYLIEASVEQKQQLLAAIDEQLAPTAYPPRLTINWDEVCQLQQQYPNITLGVHTVNHLDLSRHTEHTTEEVQQAVQQVEQATGQRPEHLAFPYNRYNDRVIELVKAANLRSAVAEGGDVVVYSHSSRYSLPRLDGPQSLTMLKSWTNGSFPDLSQRLLRRCWAQPH